MMSNCMTMMLFDASSLTQIVKKIMVMIILVLLYVRWAFSGLCLILSDC